MIADHMRAVTFLIADGVRPSNEDRGYVLRRLIRRSSASLRKIGVSGPGLHKLSARVVDLFADPYVELRQKQKEISAELLAEEERFAKTLDVGMERLTQAVAGLKKSGAGVLPGEEAFVLYDTYGFPLELTEEVLREEGVRVDRAGFDREMESQKTRARAAFAAAHAGSEAIYMSIAEPTGFVGYEEMSCEASVVRIARGGQFIDSAVEGDSIEILFARTPFYAERGGQVGDRGRASGVSAEIEIEYCIPVGKVSVHQGKIVRGKIRPGDKLTVSVDPDSRKSIMRNHTATHLVHAALRNLLGDHVKQAGSLVASDRLRFDFSHGSALGEKAQNVELSVNRWILENLPVKITEMTMAEAQKTGATMLFDEKYGDRVRVVRVGSGESVELCGGTHCRSTGEIGLFKIISDSALAAGVRRIEAVTGLGALAHVQSMTRETRAIERDLKVPLSELPAMVEKIQKEKKELEKKLRDARMKGGSADDLLSKQESADGVTFIVAEVADADIDTLRGMAERSRDKISGPVFLGSRSPSGVQLVMAVPKNMTDRYHAGKIIGQAALAVGGKGGGRPDFAQAGGKESDKLPAALDEARRLIGKPF